MGKVYIVEHTSAIPGRQNRLIAFDSYLKAKNYVESIPNIVEDDLGFWDCYELSENLENLYDLGYYIIHSLEVV